jgi:DNA-binding NarL/FixJ family response regulator
VSTVVIAETWESSQAKARPYRPWMPEGPGNPLTARERDVVLAASRGLGSEAIATYLGVARGTVRTHKQNILRKLKVGTMTGAVALCLRREWIS